MKIIVAGRSFGWNEKRGKWEVIPMAAQKARNRLRYMRGYQRRHSAILGKKAALTFLGKHYSVRSGHRPGESLLCISDAPMEYCSPKEMASVFAEYGIEPSDLARKWRERLKPLH